MSKDSLENLVRDVGDNISGSTSIDEAAFNQLALRIARFQAHNLLAYAKLAEFRGINVDSLEHWQDLPFCHTDAFKDYDMTVIPVEERIKRFVSSGTTAGVRGQHHHSKLTLELYEHSLDAPFEKHFLAPQPRPLRVVSLTPEPTEVSDSSLVHMLQVGTVRNETEIIYHGRLDRHDRWGIDPENTCESIGHWADAGPIALVGTAFLFAHLLTYMESHHRVMNLPHGSRILETGGYKGHAQILSKDQFYTKLAERFGIEESWIVGEYGMCELSSQAYDRVAGSDQVRQFQFPPWVRTQIISPDSGAPVNDGQEGILRIVDLANIAAPCAIETGDLAIQKGQRFQLVGRVTTEPLKGCSLHSAFDVEFPT